MGRSKRKKASGNDITALPVVASQQQLPKASSAAVEAKTPVSTSSGRGGGRAGEVGSRQLPQLLGKASYRGTGSRNSGGNIHNLPTITRGPEALRQAHHHGSSPLQRTPFNQAAVSKIEYLSKIATWAAANEISSLGAFYGERLASTCQSAGIPSPVLNSQCARCESVLLPDVNCSVRAAPKAKIWKNTRRKVKAGEATAAINMVVYKCHYCKYRNRKSGTPKQAKAKLAEAAARAQMKDFPSRGKASAPIDPSTPAQGMMKSSVDGDPSTIPVTPAESLSAVFSPATIALQGDDSVNSGSKKRKRKGWTGLKAMTASLQNRKLPTPERLGFPEDFSSLLKPRVTGSI